MLAVARQTKAKGKSAATSLNSESHSSFGRCRSSTAAKYTTLVDGLSATFSRVSAVERSDLGRWRR